MTFILCSKERLEKISADINAAHEQLLHQKTAEAANSSSRKRPAEDKMSDMLSRKKQVRLLQMAVADAEGDAAVADQVGNINPSSLLL